MQLLGGAASDVSRDEEVNGKPPRIAPLREDELSPEAAEYCKWLRGAMGIPETGLIPGVTATMLRHMDLNDAQTTIGVMLTSKGKISPRERELAVLRGGWITGAPFEWSEHVVIAKRLGISAEEIERIIEGGAAPGWSAHEAALLTGVDELLSRFMISDETWATLAQSWDQQQLMEFPILVGVYAATAMQQNSLRVTTEGGKPGLTSR
ncbi:MAG: carboxymuconolactone decarboxylase family protein [Novosphingobium sp.]